MILRGSSTNFQVQQQYTNDIMKMIHKDHSCE